MECMKGIWILIWFWHDYDQQEVTKVKIIWWSRPLTLWCRAVRSPFFFFLIFNRLWAPGTIRKTPWCAPRQRQAGREGERTETGRFSLISCQSPRLVRRSFQRHSALRMEPLTRMQTMVSHSHLSPKALPNSPPFWPEAQWRIPGAVPAPRPRAAFLAHCDKLCSAFHFAALIAPLQRADLTINNLTEESRWNYPTSADANVGCWPLLSRKPVEQPTMSRR